MGHASHWRCDNGCGKELRRKRSFTPSIDWYCAECQVKEIPGLAVAYTFPEDYVATLPCKLVERGIDCELCKEQA
jgi:hypothetical protein